MGRASARGSRGTEEGKAVMARLTVDVEIGPTLRTALDVLDLVCEQHERIPEWQTDERHELRDRANALVERVNLELAKQGA